MPLRESAAFQLTKIRLLEFVREPETVFWVFAFPLILAIVLGLAFNSRGPDVVHIGVVQGVHAQERVEAFEAVETIEATLYESAEEANAALVRGKVALIVEPSKEIAYRFDSARPESHMAHLETDRVLQKLEGRENAFEAEIHQISETGSRYIDFLIPGLLGMNLMGTGLWGIAFSIVQTRQRKLMKRFLVTPMKRSSYLLSHINSRMIFFIAEVATLTAFGMWAFDVPQRGSWFSFMFLCFLGTLSFCGLGLLLGSRAKTIESATGLMNLAMMPMWLLSGIFFSYENFPDVMIPIVKALPLTALNDALRATMLEGASILTLWPEMSVMAAWSVVTYFIALRIFRWQ